MTLVADFVLYLVMACALLGAVASIIDDQKGLGREFLEGLRSIGHIFIPTAGIMASIPYLSRFVEYVAGPIFSAIGADPSIAATSIIAVDMGGYQLAHTLAQSKEAWIISVFTGFMAGPTIIFSIPVGLAMLDKKDHRYMALGFLSGVLSIPIGVFVSCLFMLGGHEVRSEVSTNAPADYFLSLTLPQIARNLMPLAFFTTMIAVGLKFLPDLMIKCFLVFGKVVDSLIKIVLVLSIIEYFTGIFSKLFGSWGFAPIIADKNDQFRALEIAGYIGIMLCGAFPMVYLINRFLSKPIASLGKSLGLNEIGAAGILASMANILAMFRLIKDMRPKDKVINLSFAVCAAFLFGDHLAFATNFQPTLVLPIVAGKFAGGVFAIFIAYWLSVPSTEKELTLGLNMEHF